MIQINNRDPRPIYEQVKDGICKLMVSGGIMPDEKLPSVRELASSLAINPNTIQRAYRELESEGYIYTVPGKGAFAAEQETAISAYTRTLYKDFDAAALKLLATGESAKGLKAHIDELSKKGESNS